MNKQVKQSAFEQFATKATLAAGSTPAFLIACFIIVAWVVSGPVLNFLTHGNS